MSKRRAIFDFQVTDSKTMEPIGRYDNPDTAHDREYELNAAHAADIRVDISSRYFVLLVPKQQDNQT